MPFLTEQEPERGVRQAMAPGIHRIVAPNPGPMCYHGTNTYLIEGAGGTTVIDPGPDDASHIEAIVAGAAGPICRILVSHFHADHSGAAVPLGRKTGAPVQAFPLSPGGGFAPDLALADGDEVDGLRVVHTPGHAPDHICFATADGILFTGDHVMSWASTMISPRGGDMQTYMESLRHLLTRSDALYLPGHGPPIFEPHEFVRDLLDRRRGREGAIAEALRGASMRPEELVDALYPTIDPTLRRAAQQNLLAHLVKLESDGVIVRDGEIWSVVRASPATSEPVT